MISSFLHFILILILTLNCFEHYCVQQKKTVYFRTINGQTNHGKAEDIFIRNVLKFENKRSSSLDFMYGLVVGEELLSFISDF